MHILFTRYFFITWLCRQAAGKTFENYATIHVGIGVWDTNTDLKLTIEFVSNDYVGSLLPVLLTDGKLYWNNSASIVVTSPTNDYVWQSAQYIGDSDGAAYNDLISYLSANQQSLFSIYQPVTVVNQLNTINKQLLEAKNSWYFCNIVIQRLSSYGVDLKSFLPVIFEI